MKKIVVLGAGESGVGAAVLAKNKGFEVFVSDNGKIKEKYRNVLSHHDLKWEEAQHTESEILSADKVVVSPGIPETTSIIRKIRTKGVPIVSEIEFAFEYTDAKIIGITGTNGKTTTTLLTYHILKSANLNVGLAGNIGKSFALQVAENKFDYYVVELSSFQLDGIVEFKPDIAVILNITPDHLERYDNKMQNYVNSKFKITQNMNDDDVIIYCLDDDTITSELSKRKIKAKKIPFSIKKKPELGAFLEPALINNQITNQTQLKIIINQTQFTMFIQDLALQGKHNIFNTMAAAISANIFDIRKDVIRESLIDFNNIEHRLEFVFSVHGIEFINDSKATNVNSTWYALESTSHPIIWIAGGVDKGNDYSILKDLVKDRVKAIICLGKGSKKLQREFSKLTDTIVKTNSMSDAVKIAYDLGKKGDKVLLSPACASFDLFENYEDRGRQFKLAVREL